MHTRILIVEDDLTLRETLQYNFEKEGLLVEVAPDAATALSKAREIRPDIVILDVMLPGMDGLEVCRILRREIPTVTILMLTARADEVDKVLGLEIGADDYLTKPFSMRELLARVRAHSRRMRLQRTEAEVSEIVGQSKQLLVFGNLHIDNTRREVFLDGQSLRLTPKEYDVLLFLAQHKGVALSRDVMLERIWGWAYDGNSRTVDVHVRWLREKIESKESGPSRIITVRGIGYRFDG